MMDAVTCSPLLRSGAADLPGGAGQIRGTETRVGRSSPRGWTLLRARLYCGRGLQICPAAPGKFGGGNPSRAEFAAMMDAVTCSPLLRSRAADLPGGAGQIRGRKPESGGVRRDDGRCYVLAFTAVGGCRFARRRRANSGGRKPESGGVRRDDGRYYLLAFTAVGGCSIGDWLCRDRTAGASLLSGRARTVSCLTNSGPRSSRTHEHVDCDD